MKKNNTTYHIPVLVDEVLHYINPQPGKVYLDVTFGGGGHTKAILEKEPECSVIAMDWDMDALEKNGSALQELFPGRLTLIWGSFVHAKKKLKKEGIDSVDGILADFGTSQYQISMKPGFSFSRDTLLDMRMAPSHQRLTAQEVLNKASEKKLEGIFRTYGEEYQSKKIARLVVEQRKKKQLKTTGDLVDIVKRVIKGHKKTHPATKVFQALRIYVNQELDNIKGFLPIAVDLLNSNGRLVCISFHSLEDRIVKQFFKHQAIQQPPSLTILTPKAVVAAQEELIINPSARSAKLRAAQRC